ncbi:MAG: radical SAM family heme chaperone HemW [Bacteroidales bacterium]|nr:radical SAM family heme chaperone HemW [Bacteroidales bacterium]
MIYIHVPYCRSFCSYCGFYSELVPKCGTEAFVNALCVEITARAEEITEEVNTLYIGGGTPSVLPLSAFARILEALKASGHGGPYEEFTVEVNPEDVLEKGEGYVRGLLALGVNRISMGVQSFDPGVLKVMNRRHDAAGALAAVRLLRSAGVKNLGIDLIFGLGRFEGVAGGQVEFSSEVWERTLAQALELHPEHISAYQLSIEEGSAIEKLLERGKYSEADDDDCAAQYSSLCKVLADAGYHHYEVSNFALPGHEAVHNAAYWRRVPYAGFGPGAHTLLPASLPGGDPVMRTWNNPSLKGYLKAAVSGDFESVRERETLGPEEVRDEKIMLGLRTSEGIPASLVGTDPASVESMGLESLQGDRVRIPESRLFVSDLITGELLRQS